MKSYVAKRRLWLTLENRHAEAGETVKLPDEVGQKLIGTGAVEAAQTYTPPPAPEPVEVVAMRAMWSVVEQREVPSGETFHVRAEDVATLIESGAVRLPEPATEQDKPTAKSKKKGSD